MFIHGLHVVSEVRDRVKTGDAEATTEIYLSRESENGSSILVAFSAASAASLTLLGTRPYPSIQYSLPPGELDLFLKKFPLGAMVSSTMTVPKMGSPSLTLRRFDEAHATVADADLSDLLGAANAHSMAAVAGALSFDSRFVHVWTTNGRQYEFKPDGSYFVHENLPFALKNSGARLEWGPMMFDRLSGDPTGIAGHWMSTAGDEDVLLRSDGTYVWHSVGEFPDALGTWSVADTNIASAELRANCSTNSNEITYDAVYSGSYVGDFVFSNGDKTLTIIFDGAQVVFTRP